MDRRPQRRLPHPLSPPALPVRGLHRRVDGRAPDQAFLADTRAQLMEALAVNPVVKRKVEEECKRVLSLAASYVKSGAGKAALVKKLKAERDILKTKLVAL